MIDLDATEIDELLSAVGRIPPDAREYTVAISDTRRRFGLSEELLDQFVGFGFPVAKVNGVPCFEESDLINLSLRMRTGTNYRTIGRFWPEALRVIQGRERVGYTVNYVARCPAPGHGECHFQVLTPSDEIISTQGPAVASEPLYKTDIWLRCDWPELTASAKRLVDTVSGFELTWLPRTMQSDIDFMRRTGLATCGGVAKMLVAEGPGYGVDVRLRYGLLTSPPYASHHFWAEVKVGDQWVPIDPLMINAMLKWQVLDALIWSPYRSLGGVLCGLALRYIPPVTHDGESVRVSYPISHIT